MSCTTFFGLGKIPSLAAAPLMDMQHFPVNTYWLFWQLCFESANSIALKAVDFCFHPSCSKFVGIPYHIVLYQMLSVFFGFAVLYDSVRQDPGMLKKKKLYH